MVKPFGFAVDFTDPSSPRHLDPSQLRHAGTKETTMEAMRTYLNIGGDCPAEVQVETTYADKILTTDVRLMYETDEDPSGYAPSKKPMCVFTREAKTIHDTPSESLAKKIHDAAVTFLRTNSRQLAALTPGSLFYDPLSLPAKLPAYLKLRFPSVDELEARHLSLQIAAYAAGKTCGPDSDAYHEAFRKFSDSLDDLVKMQNAEDAP